MKLLGKIIVSCKLETETGLAVGAGKEALEIGGLDHPVIKNAKGVPYLPGSSVKGKLRSLIERKTFDLTPLKDYRDKEPTLGDEEKRKEQQSLKENHNWRNVGGPFIHICPDRNCNLCSIFGRPGEEGTSEPTRLYVRDATLDEDHFKKTFPELAESNLFTEAKWENAIDRLTSAANPRNFERVPAGSQFDCEFVFNVFETADKGRFKTLVETLQWLEDDYIGSSGSRGYGKVKVKDIEVTVKKARDYEEGKISYQKEIGDLDKLVEEQDGIVGKLEVD